MASKPLHIELTPRQQALLQRQLEFGHYESVNDVISDALRALDERGAVYDDFLRAKIKASMASKKPSVPIDEAFETRACCDSPTGESRQAWRVRSYFSTRQAMI